MRHAPWLLTLALLAGCCTPEACLPENLPHGGIIEVSTDETHQKKLFELMRYAAVKDCCDSLYDHLSKRTQDEFAETTICLFWDTIEIPGYGYDLEDCIKDGEYVHHEPGPKAGEEFILVSYTPPQGDSEDNLLVRILLVHEADETGPKVRVGLQDQYEYIQAGQPDYDWNAAR